jgi:hypothetical protein
MPRARLLQIEPQHQVFASGGAGIKSLQFIVFSGLIARTANFARGCIEKALLEALPCDARATAFYLRMCR